MPFKGATDFVSAFRLRKIGGNKNEEVEQDDYGKETLLGGQIDKIAVSETFTVLGLEGVDASAKEFGLDDEVVMDGEDKVRVATSNPPK
ncbi:hypothetical protein NHQ30_009942 [Ciborinia camelliae]|nr:hypothetical protein NHQ30_009942 [Ciborinia camelliae]